ncbi:MAG: terminase small subunit [Ignavibacteria bacterium]|jgi:phage terminase small subunit|nr:terminase small subunit [Ignavibacteria bacterium]
MDKNKLSGKHKKFADLYLKDPQRNARKAYKAVYGAQIKDSTADVNASKLLKDTKVSEYIEAKEKKATEEVEVSVTWVKTKLKRFSEAKITDYFEIKNGGIYLKDLHNLPSEIVDCIQEIQQTKDGIKIKLVDKKSSVVDLGRHLGMFSDNVNIKGNLTLEDYILDLEKEEKSTKEND